jgi:hypothetical protein
MNTHLWTQHFRDNQHRFTEPSLPVGGCALPPSTMEPLRHSMAIFQLGESGGGTRLMKYVQRVVSADRLAGYEQAVGLFIAEEQYHARLLAKAVTYMGGACLEKQWSNSVFRWLRNHFGVEFNIQILLIAELIAEVYFGILYRKCGDPALRRVCHKLLSDEMRHIAFHTEFLRERLASMPLWRRVLWRGQFRLIQRVTAVAVAWDHRQCFRALGVRPIAVAAMAFKTGERFLRRLGGSQQLWMARPVVAGSLTV